MFRESKLAFVQDVGLPPEHLSFVRALHNPPGGRVVCVLSPRNPKTARSTEWLGADLLSSMSKTCGGRGKNADEHIDLLAAWMTASDVEHLFVVHADALRLATWTALAELSALTGTGVWMLAGHERPPRSMAAFAEDWGVREVTWPQFERTWKNAPSIAPPKSTPRFPLVPEVDFLFFLPECRRLLDGDDLRKVEAEFHAGAQRTRDWLAKQSELSSESVAAFLRDLSRDCHETSRATTRLHAGQAACFGADILVTLDHSRFEAAWEDQELSIDEDNAAALRSFIRAQFAALPAVVLLTGATVDEVVALAMSDLTVDGATLTIGDVPWTVPEFARDLLRAHRLQRLLTGAQSSDPLFARIDGGEVSTRGVDTALRKAGSEVGVRTKRYWNRRKADTAENAMRRLGVTVRPLNEDA